MKSAYLLLAAGFVFVGLLAEGCVSGDTVSGNNGGHTGNSGNGGKTGTGNHGSGGGTSFGSGGFTGGGQGGFISGGQGGFTAGGQGGNTGVAGAGAAGSGVSGCPRTVADIDNFDEAGRGGPATGGYFNLNCSQGSWYTYGDTAGTVTPATGVAFVSSMPGNGGTGYAAHIMGSGFSMYGVGLGVNLNSSQMTIKNVDASAYSGFTFFAKGTATGSLTGTNAIRVAVPVPASADQPNGGTCTAVAPMYCNGHWGKIINLTSAWTQYTVKWSELTLDMNSVGGPSFTPGTVIGFHWQANGATGMPASIDMWVDDLAFTP